MHITATSELACIVLYKNELNNHCIKTLDLNNNHVTNTVGKTSSCM